MIQTPLRARVDPPKGRSTRCIDLEASPFPPVISYRPVDEPMRLARMFETVASAPEDDNLATRICVACASALPVDGAVLALMTNGGNRSTIGASDDWAGRLDELEFTVGEGPGTEAFTTGSPVLVSNIKTVAGARWPMFTSDAAQAGVRAIFSFPLQVGAIHLGALSLYRHRSAPLASDDLRDALRIADIVTLLMLDPDSSNLAADFDARWLHGSLWTREVSQATGMLTVQLGVTGEEALARLRAHAFAQNRSLSEVAQDVVARRLRLTDDN